MSAIREMLAYRWAPYLLSLMRIAVALTYLEHGTEKMFQYPPSTRPAAAAPARPATAEGAAPAASRRQGASLGRQLFPYAKWIEVIGGTLILFGLFTRPVAFILSGECAVIYFLAHAPNNFFPLRNGGEAAVLFAWIFIYIFAAGGGPISLDRLFWRSKAI